MQIISRLYYYILVLLVYSLATLGLHSVYALADGVKVTGQTSVVLPVIVNQAQCLANKNQCNLKKYKEIKLQTVKLNASFKDKLKRKFIRHLSWPLAINTSNLTTVVDPAIDKFQMQVDLGMANVPVLDQGQHGTCVTFATTGILDAYFAAGDYISQQCLLELGLYEELSSSQENDDYVSVSGWNGAFYKHIITRINSYGVVSKKNCPHSYARPFATMAPDEYAIYSNNAQWSAAFNWQELYEVADGHRDSGSIAQVKAALDNGHRVLVATLLIYDHLIGEPISNLPNGFWDLPNNYGIKQFLRDFENYRIGGHAMIVIGYDDAKQVFKIRNSWGSDVGDNGNFYMSYRYFDTMNMDTIEIY